MNTGRFIGVWTVLFASAAAWAAEGKPTVPPGAARVGSETQPAAAVPPSKDETIREQTIYVPYSKLQKVFEQQGRGVYLPYDEFQKLWAQARASLAKGPDHKPPVPALITQIESKASVGDQVLEVDARVTVEVLAEGWHEVPLRLGDAAILSAKIGDQPARIVAKPDVGYVLLVEKKGPQPQSVELALQYTKAITKSPGQNTVALQAPQAPVNQWRIRIPQAGVKVNVHPLIAATEASKAEPPKPDAKADPAKPADPTAKPAPKPVEETVVMAFVGAAPTVQIDWTPKAEGATGLEALATVQADQQVTLDEGVLRTRVQLAYKISRAELPRMTIETPADHKVLNVFDPNIKEWKVDTKGEVSTISVELYQPARETQMVTVELEKFSEDWQKAPVSMPMVKALGVGRQQGVLVVGVAPTLRAEAANRSGLSQLDAAELPPAFAGKPWTFSFRYAALPFTLSLTVEQVKPQIRTKELVEAYLEPERFTLNLLALYEIERAGVFQLELEIPPKFDVRAVRGQAAADAQPVAIDAHHVVDGAERRSLVVNLSRKALGKVGLFVELQQKLDDKNLKEPTKEASEIPVLLPRVAAAGIEQMTGRLLIYAPESLRIDMKKADGVQSIAPGEAFEGTASMRQGRFAGTREVHAYAYGREAVDVRMGVLRQSPQINVRQLLVARIKSGVVEYEATLFYDIRYSSVQSLRLDVPAALAGAIHDRPDSAVTHERLVPQPAGLDAKKVEAWKLTGKSELFGSITAKFVWEQKMSDAEMAKGWDVLGLRPQGVMQDWGQIVLTKVESLDVQPAGEADQRKGLRPIDPQHDLMPGVEIPDAARAFQFDAAEWSLKVIAKRYELEEVKRTSIDRAVVQIDVTRSGDLAVQALYRLQTVRQRLAVKLPEKATVADANAVRLGGKPVTLEKGDQGEYFVPLVGQKSDKPLLLELRYNVPGTHRQLDLPYFPEEPAVQKVVVCVFLPPELTYLGCLGPWTDEMRWSQADLPLPPPVAMSMPPHSQQILGNAPARSRMTTSQSPDQLVRWVMAGTDVSGPPQESHVGERQDVLYVFSTLRPEPPPEGSLRLVAIRDTIFNGLVFGVLVLAGLFFLPQSLGRKVGAVAALLGLMVVSGVFMPTFARQAMGGAMSNAIKVVLIAWAAWYGWKLVQWLRVEIPRRQAERAARIAAAQAAAAAAALAAPAAPSGGDAPAGSPFSTPTGSAPPTGDAQSGQTR